MNHEMLIALATFALVTSVTPGPNNMMLMASGANFGFRRTLPHLLGVAFGFGLMVAILGLGVAQLIAANPVVAEGLKWISLAYILWLAWKMVHAAAPEAVATEARPMTFLQAAAFQWINPKAWAMALGAISAYAAGVGGVLIVAAIFTGGNLPSVSVWVVMGQMLRQILNNPLRLRLFNWLMAGLLVASMLPILFEGGLAAH